MFFDLIGSAISRHKSSIRYDTWAGEKIWIELIQLANWSVVPFASTALIAGSPPTCETVTSEFFEKSELSELSAAARTASMPAVARGFGA